MGVRALSSSKAVAATVQTIGLRIVTGSYAEGMILPKEIDLAAEHGIGRSTLREAVKLLAGKGLVRTARRYGTSVCPKSIWNFLDPDILDWYASVPDNIPDLLLSIIELRAAIEPAIASLAATRASREEATAIRRKAEALMQVLPAAPVECDVAFHVALLRSTHNLLFVSLVPTYETLLRAQFRTSWSIMDKNRDYFPDERHLQMAHAVVARDTAAASRIAQEMMKISKRNVEDVSEKLGLVRRGPPPIPRLLAGGDLGGAKDW
jgi:GntR family transcriptional regulator, galactonate operon transcriptional repressor